MSHWVAYKSEVLKDVKPTILKKALKDMGLELIETGGTIQNTWGKEQVDMIVAKNGRNLTLGFNWEGEGKNKTIKLVGDFYSTGVSQSSFMDSLSQNYQKHKFVNVLKQNAWVVESTELNANGEIELYAYQY